MIQLRFSAFNFLNHPLPQFNANGNGDVRLNFVSGTTNSLSQTNTNPQTTGYPAYTVGNRLVEMAVKFNF